MLGVGDEAAPRFLVQFIPVGPLAASGLGPDGSGLAGNHRPPPLELKQKPSSTEPTAGGIGCQDRRGEEEEGRPQQAGHRGVSPKS